VPLLPRWTISWIATATLCVGCNGNVSHIVPPPTGSPSPPNVNSVGTLAVVNISDRNAKRVWAFPPNSDQFTREIKFPDSKYDPNSLAFDGKGHLYVGFNNTEFAGSYGVVEVNLRNSDVLREIRVAQWPQSSVATDDQDNLYVANKALIGGDVNLYGNNKDTKPYARIKNHRSPVTMTIGGGSLWVGYEGVPNNALARYRLRSTEETWFKTIGDDVPISLAANADGSLLAAFVKRKSDGRAVDIYDVKSGTRARTLLHENNLAAMTSDGAGDLYVAETGQQGTGDAKIHACTFRGCSIALQTHSRRAIAMAISPLDGKLYVTMDGKPSVQVFNTKTGNFERIIIRREFEPTALALEP
jgi:hypothetical protein